MRGHFWTVGPYVASRVRAVEPPPSRAFSTTVADARLGAVPLHGLLTPTAGATSCLVIVHGLGGDATARYAVEAARAAQAAGMAALRLDLRGAGGRGDDVYSAAVSGDVHAALASPELSAYQDLYLLGFSLGGHIVLRAGVEAAELDRRVRAVAAICPPLDLEIGARAFDGPAAWPYRRHVLASLVELAHVLERRGRLPCALAEAKRVRRIRDWDRLVVAPRYGHSSPEAYYEAASVAPRLTELARPALLVAAEADPMIPARVVRAGLARAPGAPIDVRWVTDGGHVGFPASLDLGERGPRGLAAQVLAWMLRTAR